MLVAFSLKMLQYYLLLLQVLFASELYGWSMDPELDHLRKETCSENLENTHNMKELAVMQFLNHFDQTDLRRWGQPYAVLNGYYRPGGPALLTINTENGPAISYALIRNAKKFGAVIFILQHRYYGNSRPVENTSTENLQYLTSEQALADAAFFIATMKANGVVSKDTKWIAFGGGYEGSLAAWLRLKYPHLIHGAVASSAPFDFKITFPDYYINSLFNSIGNNTACGNSVTAAFGEFATLLQNQTGQQKLATLFNLCESAPAGEFTYNDKTNLNKRLVDLMTWPRPTPYPINETRSETDKSLCEIMTDQEMGTPLNRLAAYINTFGFDCVSYKYDKLKKALQDTEWTRSFGARQHLYQICTEFGLFPTDEYTKPIFRNNDLRSFYRQLCYDAFGRKYATFSTLQSGIAHTHTTYGGTNIDVTKVVFVQGTADPWFVAGMQKNISSEAPTIIIEGAGHCWDMSSPKFPQVEAAREKIEAYIESWLKK